MPTNSIFHEIGYEDPEEAINFIQALIKAEDITFGRNIVRNRYGNNANIKLHILSPEKMYKAGFVEDKDSWEFCKFISLLDDITFNVIIDKNDQDDYLIDVRDEATGLYLEWQDREDGVSNSIRKSVEYQMLRLMDAGIVSGYKIGDYI